MRVVVTRLAPASGWARIGTMLTGCAHSLALAGAANASETRVAATSARSMDQPVKRGAISCSTQRVKRAVSVRAFVPSVKVTLAVSLWTPVFSVTLTLVVASVPLLEALAVRELAPVEREGDRADVAAGDLRPCWWS